MRHVSRTHRVALDLLFDRINLEPKIETKYLNTKNQVADILTKGSFSRDEWNHFLCLFNIMNFSMYSCSHFGNSLSDNSDQVGKQSAMSKRGHKTTSNEGSPKANARPCLVLREQRSKEISSRSLGSLVNPVNADERQEVERASRQLAPPDSNSKIGYSQANWQENVPQATRKLVLEDRNQTECDERKYCNSTSSRKLAASSPELKNMEYTNHRYMGKIFQFLQRDWECQQATQQRRMFITSSMKADIHLGPNYVSNSEVYKNTKFEDIESVFNITQKLAKEHCEEILNVRCSENSSPPWTRLVLANDQAIKWAKANVCFCADSVLCVGQQQKDGKDKWKDSGCIHLTKMQWVSILHVNVQWHCVEHKWWE